MARNQSPMGLTNPNISKREAGVAKSTHFALGSEKPKLVSEAQQNYVDRNANAFVLS
jgi:hypothetical protein